MPEKTEFAQFFHRYLMDHARPGTRFLHFLGTSTAIAGLLLGIVMLNPALTLAGIALGYILSWCGHLFIERNMPSLVAHPLWSFQSDIRMFRLWLTGRLDAEYKRAKTEGTDSKEASSKARSIEPGTRSGDFAKVLERG